MNTAHCKLQSPHYTLITAHWTLFCPGYQTGHSPCITCPVYGILACSCSAITPKLPFIVCSTIESTMCRTKPYNWTHRRLCTGLKIGVIPQPSLPVLYTLHYTLHAVCYMLYDACCMLHAARCQCTFHTVKSTLQTAHCNLHTETKKSQTTKHTVNAQITLHSVESAKHTVHCTLHTV